MEGRGGGLRSSIWKHGEISLSNISRDISQSQTSFQASTHSSSLLYPSALSSHGFGGGGSGGFGLGSGQSHASGRNGVVLPTEVEAFLAVSPDSLLVVQDNSHHDVLFITANQAVIGWTAAQASIRIYFHQVCVNDRCTS